MLQQALLLLIVSSIVSSSNELSQVVVLDAGSSGTRIHIYNFNWEDHVPRIDKTQIEEQTKKIRPGLSTLSDSNDMEIEKSVVNSFTSLFNFAKTCVSIAARSKTPVILKATAGMRLVPPRKASKIMNAARNFLVDSEFLFLEADWASIIAGSEEAGLAWIASNYLSGAFDNAVSSNTVGVVEMGGASSQISFAVQNQFSFHNLNNDRRFKFTDFYGHAHYVYATSYLGFGRDQAYARLDSVLVKNVGGQSGQSGQSRIIAQPCHRTGYTKTYTDTTTATSVVVQGSGDYIQCLVLIERWLFNASVTDQPPIIPGTELDQGALAPTNSASSASRRNNSDPVPLVATEVFYYVRDEFRASSQMNSQLHNRFMELSPESTLLFGRAVCTSSINEKEGREDSCFTVGFQAMFLKYIGVTRAPKIVRDIGGVQMEWAIGAAIQHLVMYGQPPSSNGAPRVGVWSFGETIVFALGVTFAVLGSLVVVVKWILATDCLSDLCQWVYRMTGGSGGRAGGGGIRARRKRRGSPKVRNYDRVQTQDDDENGVAIEIGQLER